MKNTFLALSIAAALTGCGKDKGKEAPKKEPTPAPAAGSGTAATDTPPAPAPIPTPAPTTPAAPADPTASWTEHKGPGFVVKGARTPEREDATTQTSLGPQPIEMYVGYEPAGFKGSFQAAVSDMAAAAKGATLDPKKTVDDSVEGLLRNMGLKVEKDEPIEGADAGRAIVASGNHPQGGPFAVHARVYFRGGKIFIVQALHADPNDAPLAAAFVSSFKFVDSIDEPDPDSTTRGNQRPVG